MKISYRAVRAEFGLTDFATEVEPGRGPAPVDYCWKFSLSITPEQVWPYVADTATFNRYIGLAPRTEKEINGQRWVQTTVFGVPQEWVEDPWVWIHEQSLQFVRRYSKGIAIAVRNSFFVKPTATGCDVFFVMNWLPRNFATRTFLSVTDGVMHSKFEQAMKVIELSFRSDEKTRNRRALSVPNDPATNVNMVELEMAERSLKALNTKPAAVDALIQVIKFGDDADLYRLRAIELARQHSLSKRDVVKACMHAVRLGLLSISWDVVCPHCRGVRIEAESLGNIPPNSECFVCDVDFETDTLESIEVTFHVNPLYRKVPNVLFCSAEPAKRDHIQVQHRLAPGQTMEISIGYKDGRHRVRSKELGSILLFDVTSEATDQKLAWNSSQGLVEEKYNCGPRSSLSLQNSSDTVLNFTVEQLWWKDGILHPADVFSLYEFRDIFSRESLNPQVRMSLGIQTILFTDIVNSTGFYNSRGDAGAFSEVRKHFTEVFHIISEHEGTVIKTIGDSVMASFLSVNLALKASLIIQENFAADRSDTEIRVRVSVHTGPVIAVHLNQGLDLFGNTVNKAAKLQSCANGGEIAMSKEVRRACDEQLLKSFLNSIETRTSSVHFQEAPLQADVLKCHAHVQESKKRQASA